MITPRKDESISNIKHKEMMIRAQQGWLIPGSVPESQFWLLIGISSMHSEKVIKALFDYLVNGMSRKDVCNNYSVNSGHFSIGLNRLQHLSHTAAKLSEYYHQRF